MKKIGIFVCVLGALVACNQDDACPVPNLEGQGGGGGPIFVPVGGAGGLGAEPGKEAQAAVCQTYDLCFVSDPEMTCQTYDLCIATDEPSPEPQAAGGGSAEELSQGKCGDDTLKCKCNGALIFEPWFQEDPDPDSDAPTGAWWFCDIRPGVKMPTDCTTLEQGLIKLCWERLAEYLKTAPGLTDAERQPVMWWQRTPPEDTYPLFWKCRYEQ